jgi:hypothetical protein
MKTFTVHVRHRAKVHLEALGLKPKMGEVGVDISVKKYSLSCRFKRLPTVEK